MLHLLCSRVTLTDSVLDRNDNLVRLFGVLKTLADLGPAATAERDFSETAADVLDKTLHALDAIQGALFVFEPNACRLDYLASAGIESLSDISCVDLSRTQAQAWFQL